MGFFDGLLGKIAGPILGGLIGKKEEKKAIAAQNAYNDPSAQRARLEAAGFNPAPFMGGPGAGLQTSYARPMMGSAIAQASQIITEEMARKDQLEVQKTQLQFEREKFEEQKRQIALLEVPGIYRPNSGGIRKPAQSNDSQLLKKEETPISGPVQRDYGPQPLPAEKPTTLMGDEGMTMANPEMSSDPETDLWRWGKNGTIIPNLYEMYKRNTMTPRQRKRMKPVEDKIVDGFQKGPGRLMKAPRSVTGSPIRRY